MILHLNAVLPVGDLWTDGLDTCTSACHGKVFLLSPSLAGPQEMFAFTQTHMCLVHYRELFCVEMPFSFVCRIFQAHFHALQVEEEFFEVRGRFLELGKTISLFFQLAFCFFNSF